MTTPGAVSVQVQERILADVKTAGEGEMSPQHTGGPKVTKPAFREGDRVVKVLGGSATHALAPAEKTTFSSDNEVITSRYHWWNFLFLNLFEQFLNVANIYFLIVGLLQIWPSVTTTNGLPSMYEPLAFIVFVSAVRAASEDWARHKADALRNGYCYDVLETDGHFKPLRSGDLTIGRIVRVRKNEMVPADMLFLGSALPKGHCFIDKANLNGETTLEVLSSIQQTREWCAEGQIKGFHCELMYEPPNKRFDSFRGHMTIFQPDGTNTEVTITGKHLLMRETNLKNCDFIFGLVVYTGNDTKIQRSNLEGEKPKIKVSRIMRYVQQFLKYMLLVQMGMCVFGGLYAGIWLNAHGNAYYLFPAKDGTGYPHSDPPSSALAGFYSFFSWFILLSQMVPISLIVSAELVKFAQSRFIQWDRGLYWKPINKPTKCNSSTIHEDLGLIDYVFSDKTGTLTQNKMEFRYALLPFSDFGSKETEIAKAVKARKEEVEARRAGNYKPKPAPKWSVLVKPLQPPRERDEDCCATGACSLCSPCWNEANRAEDKDAAVDTVNANCFTPEERDEMLKALWGPPPAGEEKTYKAKRDGIRRYITHMALSNTVKPYDDGGVLKFQAEAAEETAMVNWARSMGFLKRSQNPTILEVTEYSEDLKSQNVVIEKYNHLATLGFTSARARVTVIYQRVSDGKIVIMTKGQDTVILPLLKKCPDQEALMLELNALCTNGLRTLVCGHSERDEKWWDERHAEYEDVISRDESEFSQGHSDGKCQKAKCEKCLMHNTFAKFENDADFEYMGCMGLEDQLQLLVPECIRDCLRAGVKVWMITGDKLETAKNIGLACNLIDPDMAPTFHAEQPLDEAIRTFSRSRLIEITGQWASLKDKLDDLRDLFDTLDTNRDGQLELKELEYCLQALRFGDSARIQELFKDIDVKNGGISKDQFVQMISGSKLSNYDAVLFDVDEGIATYQEITDHEANPISLLVNRSAFEVMFPGKLAPGMKPEAGAPTEEMLESLRKKFFKLAIVAKSVVFARAQPAMKKKMVTEIQLRRPQAITLAIGDGANDTDMIQAAHIGVGIAGVEGTAATNSADYAIGTFNMLHTLLFVHGFWSYRRIAALVNFIFYKASLIAMTGYYFGFLSGFSGQQFYNDPPYQLYNVVYTALPVMAVAILNKDLPRDTLQNNPSIYRESKGSAFSPLVFTSWIARAFLHSLIIFFIPYGALGVQNVIRSDGRAIDMWVFSTVIFFCVVLVPTFLIILEMTSITLLHVLAIWSSLGSLFLFTYLLSITLSYNPNEYGVVAYFFGSPAAWLTMLLTTLLPLLIEIALRGAQRDLRPTYTQIIQERLRNKRKQNKAEAREAHFQGQDGRVTRSATQIIVAPEDEKKWADVKTPKGLAQRNSFSKLDNSNRQRDYSVVRSQGDQLRSALVQTMLRFRNLTGSQFTSAAQAKFQSHDVMVKGPARANGGKAVVG